jgi:hypothetical protein
MREIMENLPVKSRKLVYVSIILPENRKNNALIVE